MALPSPRALFVEILHALHSSEHQLVRALPKMRDGASSRELRTMVSDCLAESESHCEQMEGIAQLVQEKLGGERCRVMEALVKQGVDLTERRGDERILDLALVMTLRQICNYRKSAYEIARSLAEVLEEGDISKMIDQMLSDSERTERALLLLSEDMSDSVMHERREGPREGVGSSPVL
jgi:ferritin-like metal-binding protein YciE